MATETKQRVVQVAARRARHRARHVPGREHDLHEPVATTTCRDSAYGAMFVPQAITAVAASILGCVVGAHASGTREDLPDRAGGERRGDGAARRQRDRAARRARSPTRSCCVATASLGVGFGFTVPALNTFTAAFNPTKVDCVGARAQRAARRRHRARPGARRGVRRARLLVGPPRARVAIVLAVHPRGEPPPAASRVDAPVEPDGAPDAHARSRLASGSTPRSPCATAICETMNGNWASLDMKDLGASTTKRRSR